MHILIAPDKFKDALTAREAAEAIQAGIQQALPQAGCSLLPLADGGEGSTELLTQYAKGHLHISRVHGPLLQEIEAAWGYEPDSGQAFIELAAASGLRLLPSAARNPLYTTTYGTGELIGEALKAGARSVTLGLGGSATNDGGCGMAAALGYRFYGADGKEIAHPRGKDLLLIKHIDSTHINPLLKTCRLSAACDVQNPLTGPKGASFTFASQKGANNEEIQMLDEGLSHLSALLKAQLGIDINDYPGSGAAGGAGAGVLAFLKGSLRSGADLMLQACGFHEQLQQADLLLSGEGKLDKSSLEGKLLGSLLREVKRNHKKLIVFCGSTNLTEAQWKAAGLEAVIPVSGDETSLQTALQNTSRNLQQAAARYFKSNNF